MKPLFELTKGEDEEPSVRKLADEIENANITHNNYQRFVRSVENIRVVISAQIQSLHADYKNMSDEYNDLINDENTKTALENKVVPIELYKLLYSMHQSVKNMVSWKWYETEINFSLIGKLASALAEAKVVDNEREVLTRMHDMEQDRNKFLHDALVTSINTMHEKYVVSLERNTGFLVGVIKNVVGLTDNIVKQLAVDGVAIKNIKEYRDYLVKSMENFIQEKNKNNESVLGEEFFSNSRNDSDEEKNNEKKSNFIQEV